MFQFTHPGGVRLREQSTRYYAIRFQFTHPGGVRRKGLFHRRSSLCFNSRTREGCDVSEYVPAFISRVSIHAPGRGATHSFSVLVFSLVFQFTHPGGVRPHSPTDVDALRMFQFTHPGGVRRPGYRQDQAPKTFQFTHPGGVRRYGAKLRIMGRINKRNLRLEVLL